MIERLILENFQPHERVAVDLDPLVTTLVGPSDVGKSAVLRGLRWLCLNQPAGAGFVRSGAKLATVSARVDGKWVVRERGEDRNVYEFDGDTYHSLRAVPVPEAIQKHLNIGPVNFQGQIDPPFWLLETAGQVSRNLNELVNLEEIDQVLAVAASDVRQARTEVELTEARLASARTRRDDLGWVVDAEQELAELEQLEEQLAQVRAELAGLTALLADTDRLAKREAELTAAVADGTRLLDDSVELVQVASDRFCLAEVLKQVDRAEAILQSDPTADWEELVKLRAEADRAAEERRTLEHTLADITALEEKVWSATEELSSAEKELSEKLAGKCPVCGQPATASQLSFPTSTGPSAAPSPDSKDQVRSGWTFNGPTGRRSRK